MAKGVTLVEDGACLDGSVEASSPAADAIRGAEMDALAARAIGQRDMDALAGGDIAAIGGTWTAVVAGRRRRAGCDVRERCVRRTGIRSRVRPSLFAGLRPVARVRDGLGIALAATRTEKYAERTRYSCKAWPIQLEIHCSSAGQTVASFKPICRLVRVRNSIQICYGLVTDLCPGLLPARPCYFGALL